MAKKATYPMGWNQSTLVSELEERDNDYTPDYLDLKQTKHHAVFVYGNLKAGGKFHEMLKGYPSLGEGYTATKGYIMKEINGEFPIITPIMHGQEAQGGRVYGEVYIIPASAFLQIDYLEQNNKILIRDHRWVFLCDQSYKTIRGLTRPTIKTWIYMANPMWLASVHANSCIPKVRNEPQNVGDRYYSWDLPKMTIGAMTQGAKMSELWKKYGISGRAP